MVEMEGREGRERTSGIPYFNFVGTSTTYLRVYRVIQRKPLMTVETFSLFDQLEKFLPGEFRVPEMRQGRGDGLVSAERARLLFARENREIPVNHAQFLVHPLVQKRILEILKGFT